MSPLPVHEKTCSGSPGRDPGHRAGRRPRQGMPAGASVERADLRGGLARGRLRVGDARVVARDLESPDRLAWCPLRARPGGAPVGRGPDRPARGRVEVAAAAGRPVRIEQRDAEPRVAQRAPRSAAVVRQLGRVQPDAHETAAVARIGHQPQAARRTADAGPGGAFTARDQAGQRVVQRLAGVRAAAAADDETAACARRDEAVCGSRRVQAEELCEREGRGATRARVDALHAALGVSPRRGLGGVHGARVRG